jgi:putative FmdB family regulatory protein
MPTYEYRCEACGHELELFQRMSEKPVRKCPECGKLKLNRLIGAGAGLLFKGSGFYITDYRSKEYKEQAAADRKDGGGQKGDGAKGDGAKPGKDSSTTAATSSSTATSSEPSKPASSSKKDSSSD